jgi:uncharacterized protein YbjT (DUF2867 family)
MAHPILVTGAAGRVGAVGRAVTKLLLKQGKAVRAMVGNEDERAQALRDMGAEVVVGNLLDLGSMHRVIAGCETMYFGMSVSDAYLAATVNAAAVAKHHGGKAFINMSQMTLSQTSITETTASPQHKLHWLAEQALNWSRLPVVHVRPTVFLEGFFLIFTSDSVRKSNQIRLPFGEGKTSPVAAEDVARVVATLLANPQPHIGKIYHLTGPQSENMHFYAQEYSKALARTITFHNIPVEPWRDGLLKRGLPIHLVNHLATMADLHCARRYDRMSNDVLTLTGQGPLSVQECGKPPDLGQSLWPGDKWRCAACLEDHLPGKDAISKSMHKTIEYTTEVKEAFDLEANGFSADGPRNRAEWARMMAVEMKKQGVTRRDGMDEINGEWVDRTMPDV